MNTKSLILTQPTDMLETDKENRHICPGFYARSAVTSPNLEMLEVPANTGVA